MVHVLERGDLKLESSPPGSPQQTQTKALGVLPTCREQPRIPTCLSSHWPVPWTGDPVGPLARPHADPEITGRDGKGPAASHSRRPTATSTRDACRTAAEVSSQRHHCISRLQTGCLPGGMGHHDCTESLASEDTPGPCGVVCPVATVRTRPGGVLLGAKSQTQPSRMPQGHAFCVGHPGPGAAS